MTVGIIGAGFMGRMHARIYKKMDKISKNQSDDMFSIESVLESSVLTYAWESFKKYHFSGR
ncbi:MAG: hypothetical protein P8107_03465 [Spirochaetia bacterium]